MDRRALAALLFSACLPAEPSLAADLPAGHHAVRHRGGVGAAHRLRPRPVVIAPVAVGAAPVEVVVVPELGAARPPLPSPTALVLPGASGVPASVDLSPVFLPQRGCGPGFSPDALQACRRHGELRIDCDPSGRTCVPLPPDPMPYGPGAAARLAY